jgi:hypothetical protein
MLCTPPIGEYGPGRVSPLLFQANPLERPTWSPVRAEHGPLHGDTRLLNRGKRYHHPVKLKSCRYRALPERRTCRAVRAARVGCRRQLSRPPPVRFSAPPHVAIPGNQHMPGSPKGVIISCRGLGLFDAIADLGSQNHYAYDGGLST